MKRILYSIGVLAVLAFCAWLYLNHPSKTVKEYTPSALPQQSTNIVPTPAISSASSYVAPLPQTPATNAFARPNDIDEDHWNHLMLVRQMELERNQPIEFYARVEDQNAQPLQGVKLKLILTYVNEDLFQTTNFFKMNMGDEISHKTIEIISDANGWLQLTNSEGYSIDVGGLSKADYAAVRNYYGGELYEPHGIRRTFGDDVLMTNFYNPQNGYVFHLRKIDEK